MTTNPQTIREDDRTAGQNQHVGALVAAAILGLAAAVPAWLSALLVALVLFAIATVAALFGKKHVTRATPPLPQGAVDGVHEDLEALKGHQPTVHQPQGKVSA